jgi:hypothetical protein
MERENNKKGRGPMRDDFVDPRFEKLIALLYGELAEDEARALRSQLAADDALRAEYEELSAARTLLAEWEVPEKTPHFVFLTDEPSKGRATAREEGIFSSLRDRLHGLVTATPWAVAVAAVLVAFLAWKDFRIDQTNGGIAFRFGRRAPEVIQSAEQIPSLPPGTAMVNGSALVPAGNLEPGRQVDATAPQGGGAYLTRAEFNDYSNGMARTMVALLNEYSRRRDLELTNLLQGAFGRFTDRQTTDYAELRGRLDALQQGVSVQKTVTDSRLDYLMRTGAQGSLTPSGSSSDSDSAKEGAKQ